jgi:hypothetical protein
MCASRTTKTMQSFQVIDSKRNWIDEDVKEDSKPSAHIDECKTPRARSM